MQLAGVAYGLAFEFSFKSGLGFLAEHHEALIFIDEIRDLELVEGTITSSPLPLSCRDHHHPCLEDGPGVMFVADTYVSRPEYFA